MANIEKRVAALEAASTDDTLQIVVVEDGETQADALKRVGLPLDALRVMYVTPSDVVL